MKPPASSALARWLPALAVWSAVLLSLVVGDHDTAQPTLASGAVIPCAPLTVAGTAG